MLPAPTASPRRPMSFTHTASVAWLQGPKTINTGEHVRSRACFCLEAVYTEKVARFGEGDFEPAPPPTSQLYDPEQMSKPTRHCFLTCTGGMLAKLAQCV